MGCNRVVITSTAAQGGSTMVTWLAFKMPNLARYEVSLTQDGHVTLADAAATATGVTIPVAASASGRVQVTPVDGTGPVAASASAPTPVPFPPPKPNPNLRPVIVRSCSDGNSVTVNWLASAIEGLQGYWLTIFKNQSELDNFDVPGVDAISTTVAYACTATDTFAVNLTPYNKLGPVYSATSDTVALPYPAS